jgi:hypothetical protein
VSSAVKLGFTEQAFPSGLKSRQLFDDLLSAQLNDTFSAIKPELMCTCNLYLDTINASLPILIADQLRKHVADLDQVFGLELRTLLLSVYLVTKLPDQLPEGGTDLANLYSLVKLFHSNLVTTSRPSIDLIQAGLLIAVYEQGQAQDDEAYLTVGLCARMGHAIGLQKTLRGDIPSHLGSRDLLETYKHVWWSLIVLER